MVRTAFPRVAISLLAVFLTYPAVAQSSRVDQTAKAASRSEPENEFRFEVLSIKPTQRGPSVRIPLPKPNGFSATALLQQVVLFAYGPPCPISLPTCGNTDIRNQPAWFAEPYAFDARVSPADMKAWQNQGKNCDLLRSALRAALRERCKLLLHKEPRQQPMMEIVAAKGGPRLKAAHPGETLPNGVALESGGVMTFINNGRGGWNFYGATIEDLTNLLSPMSPGGPVRNGTGLTGRYDFTLRRDPSAPQVFTPEILDSFYLEELGLKLKRGIENRPDLVIDHVERPTQN